MSSKKDAMKKKLENMHLGERINYGYRMVITMMLISGLLSIAVIGVLFFNMLNYVNKVNAADQAVKTCRINVNACLLYTSPSPRDRQKSRMPSSA